MKKEKLFLIAIIILAIGLGLSWNTLLKMKEENRIALKTAQRADDYRQIQNVFAKHSYYYEAQEQWLELETAWSQKRDDISYGHNNGYYYGREAVYDYYGQKNEDRRKQTLEMVSKIYPEIENIPENEGVGDLVIHTLTTPVIEIAEDRETAQGVWMSVGLASRAGQDGQPQYNWFWEKFGVDFVREDGEWKIWHFQIFTDTGFSQNMGSSMAGAPGGAPGGGQAPPGEGAPGAGQPPQGEGGPQTAGARGGGGQPPQGEEGRGEMQGGMNRLVEMYEMYSATRVPQNIPKLPEPYETWEDTTPFIKD
jgi:hypothetical protein